MVFKRPAKRPPEADLQSYASTVAQILLNIGIDPQQAAMPVQQGYGWNFKRGSATVEIYIAVHEGVGYLQVLSPLIELPQANLLPLYRRLLETNLQITAAALGIHNDVVYVFHERPLEGLDSQEASNIINMIGAYADDLDDKLVQEFGGRLYGRI